ncbi:1-acylglycerol-3-phosphate O-acyltransferase PNPLA3 isoform X2 [Physeter macrocephalus]|uniref:phospholipase A2 n=1 Tax=Physeter macrocephalus TaxID=9755 RepID=A0A2Y9T180_PHYMC|nr:1-acylglycerol-3-phosphate O-acyltransferase PNPLA3 isoform X2 [Physeter catodon]|eukprot:XP_023983267.1 1-acylglycerol-3-phosphate O-acyltransferase PNPLA3 isoform X2 [Physeter catodon]
MDDPERGWSLSFAGCGFLGFYHIGVTRCLSERAPHLLRNARRFFGASAGALHCAFFLSGVPLEQTLQTLVDIVQSARSRNIGILHPAFNMSKHVRDGLQRYLPDNVHQILSGKIVISLTRVADGENVLVSDFRSKDEVVDALLCSSFVPFISGLIPPSFRGVVLGELCFRGYLDAVRFLEENGICDRPPLCLSASSAELEVLEAPWEHGSLQSSPGMAAGEAGPEEDKLLDHRHLSILPWDESILETLSPKLTIALREAIRNQDGYISKMCNFLPIKVMSFAVLPCTLPVESAIAAVQRLVMWLPDMPKDIQWLWWATSRLCSRVVMRLFPVEPYVKDTGQNLWN